MAGLQTKTNNSMHTQSILLSISIPTYNRSPELGELLDNIYDSFCGLSAKQKSQFQVCIHDNASTDDTVSMLSGYVSKLPILYKKFDQNMGFDRNCLACVAMAQGDYVWLVGSDDCINHEALPALFAELENNQHRVFLLKHSIFLSKTTQKNVANILPIPKVPSVVFGARDLQPMIDNVNTFTFMSSLCFKRTDWMHIAENTPMQNIPPIYSQTFIYCKILQIHPSYTGKYLYCTTFVQYRPYNDSFCTHSIQRIMVDYKGFYCLKQSTGLTWYRYLYPSLWSWFRHIVVQNAYIPSYSLSLKDFKYVQDKHGSVGAFLIFFWSKSRILYIVSVIYLIKIKIFNSTNR
jgi:glycosyltransferase involved in cell wall biosynthesis